MRQRVWLLVAIVAFVAAVLRTVPGAVRDQRAAVDRHVAGDTASAGLSSREYETRAITCPETPAGSSGVVGKLRAAKNGVCQWLVARGLGGVWRFQLTAREYLFDIRLWLWMTFFVALEQLIPAKPLRRFLTAPKILDFLYPVLNAAVRALVVVALYNPLRWLYSTYFSFLDVGVMDGLPLVVQGLGAFLVMDFAHWFSHYVRHKVRWFWHFHSIHHSQVEMSAWTAFRAHPVEPFIDSALVMVPIGIVGGDMSAWIIVTAIYTIVWPPFTHANIRTNLGIFRWILVSPQYHRVHHSIVKEQYDLNFGSHLVVWDWMFGTMYRDMEAYPDTGVPNTEYIRETSTKPHHILGMWLRHAWYPFLMIGRSLRSRAGMRVENVPGLPPQQVIEEETVQR